MNSYYANTGIILALLWLTACGGGAAPAGQQQPGKAINGEWQLTYRAQDAASLPDGWPISAEVEIWYIGSIASDMGLPEPMRSAWRSVNGGKDDDRLCFRRTGGGQLWTTNIGIQRNPSYENRDPQNFSVGGNQGYWFGEFSYHTDGEGDSLRLNIPDGEGGVRSIIYNAQWLRP